jgi:Tat protein secretion system quality control protein TatD with DNase activity
MQVWPQLYCGMSSSLTYSKCPKALLDAAYDLPLERLILTSESPHALPAALGGARRTQVCIPPHAACAAEQIASIKGMMVEGVGVDRALVLQHATANLCRVFGLPTLESASSSADQQSGGSGGGEEDDVGR